MHKSKVYSMFFPLAVLLLLPCTSRAQTELFTANDPYCIFALLPPICLNTFFTWYEADPYPFPSNPSVAGQQIAAAFVVPPYFINSGLFALAQIDCAFGIQAPPFPRNSEVSPPYYVQLAADAGGLPGTILETWQARSTPDFSSVYDKSGNVILKAGQQYWVIISARYSPAEPSHYQHRGAVHLRSDACIPMRNGVGLRRVRMKPQRELNREFQWRGLA